MAKTLRLILGDQLHHGHPWFEQVNNDVTYVLMEVRQETDYVRHHIQKVVAFFGAMRAFAEWLRETGHCVRYYRITDPNNRQNIPANLRALLTETAVERFEYQLPDEYRLSQELAEFCETLDIPTCAEDTHHFYTSRADLRDFFAGKKTYLLESYYRHLRKRENILMLGDEPVGNRWNFDADNRNKLPKGHVPPPPKLFGKDVSDIFADVQASGALTFGEIDARDFIWPLTRREALEQLRDFCERLLPHFGTYQDALHTEHWSLYHSRLSFALNAKLLTPHEVVNAAVDATHDWPGEIDLAQTEGFVRQILGWREFVRGVYWAQMPGYAQENFFGHATPLPKWFWTGETKMNCQRHAIGQSLQHAYAHHIQRLMVTGNIALLLGVHPAELDAWYLGIYIDAIEWVEMPNTRGMSQFADGGKVGTKPYVSSANYLHKMGNTCLDCHYDRNARTGPRACPFNSLYWHFFERHRDKLARNPRIGMAYRNLDRMETATKRALLDHAEAVIANADAL